MIGSAGGPGGRFLELRSFVDTTADASKRVVTTTENQKDGEFIMVKSEMPWCERCPQVCRQPCKPYTSRRLVNRYLLPHWSPLTDSDATLGSSRLRVCKETSISQSMYVCSSPSW